MGQLKTIRSILTNSKYAIDLLTDVERLYNAEIGLHHDPALEGHYYVDLESGTMYYRDENQLSEVGCLHELFHLKLAKLGCPYAALKNKNETDQWRFHIPHFLNDSFEHQLFFPDLVRQGYNPYKAEEAGLKSQLDKLANLDLSHSKSSFEQHGNPMKAFLSIVYARSFLDCKLSDLRNRCISMFSGDYLVKPKAIGEKLVEIVRNYAKDDFGILRTGLGEAIELLEQSEFLQIEADK